MRNPAASMEAMILLSANRGAEETAMPMPSRRTKAALTLLGFLATLPCAAQPSGAPTTAKDIALTTTTPLGEAAIVRPAGSEVTEPVGSHGEIELRQGPFTARIDRADLVFPAPPAVASPTPEPASKPQGTAGGLSGDARWQEDWRILAPTGAAVLLGIYSVITTVALVRRRRRWDD